MKRLSIIPQGIIWFLFLIITGFGYTFSVLEYVGKRTAMTFWGIAVADFIWILLAAGVIAGIYWLKKAKFYIVLSQKQRLFLECGVLLLVLIGGCTFRFAEPFQGLWNTETENEFFQYAQIVKNAKAYQNPHLASRLYVGCLHIVFRLLGNIYQAGTILQFVLLLVGGSLWYLAVRSTFGTIPALFFAAGAMLLPDSIRASLQYDPVMLVFTLYGVLAWLIACYKKSASHGILKVLLEICLGILAGVAVMLDLSGWILAVWYLISLKKKRVFTPFLAAGSMCLGIGTVTWLQMSLYHSSIQEALRFSSYAQLSAALPDAAKMQDFVFLLGTHPILWTAILVIAAFWFLQDKKNTVCFMAGIEFLFVLKCMGWDAGLYYEFGIYTGLFILLGIVFGQCAAPILKTSECVLSKNAEDTEAESEEEDDAFLNDKSMVVVTFEQEPQAKQTEVAMPKQSVVYIPERMEFRKRISKPKIEYGRDISEEEMHFDLPEEELNDTDYDV